MNSKPRTVELSRSNFDAAIEAFLRSVDKIKDSETPESMIYSFMKDGEVSIKITFTQEVKPSVQTNAELQIAYA